VSELENIINTSIGALFFVSGAIAVLIMLMIFILKKGTDLHNVLGYIYFFGLSFANYAAAMAYYDSLLPLASVLFTVPISTIALIIGLASIIPKHKSTFRIRLHIVAMVISTTVVAFGSLINWYHFNVDLLYLVKYDSAIHLAMLSMPLILIACMIIFHYVWNVEAYMQHFNSRFEDVKDDGKSALDKPIREGLDVIYKSYDASLPEQKWAREAS